MGRKSIIMFILVLSSVMIATFVAMNVKNGVNAWAEAEQTEVTIPPENSTIHGYVKDGYGNPIYDAEIHFYNSTYDYLYIAYTNETGYYETNVFAGYFHISLYKEGYSSWHSENPLHVANNQVVWFNATLEPFISSSIVYVDDDYNSSTPGSI